MHLIYAFGSGIVVSILSYLTLGPINLAIVQTVLNEGKHEGKMIGYGSALIDALLAFVALFGYRFVAANESFLEWFNLITIPVLIFFGLRIIAHRNRPSVFKKKVSGNRFFILGAVVCFSNPLLIVYWLYVTTTLQAQRWLGTTTMDYLLFTAGVLIGIIGFVTLLVQVVAFTKKQIPQKYFTLINVIMGLFFIGFAVFLMVKFLVEHL